MKKKSSLGIKCQVSGKGERVPALGSDKEVDWEEYKEKEKAYRKRVRNLGK